MTSCTTWRRWRGSSCGSARKQSLDMDQRKSSGHRPSSRTSGHPLDAVAHDPAAAVVALRRHQVDGALEAVEDVATALVADLHRLVVVVSASVAASHDGFL